MLLVELEGRIDPVVNERAILLAARIRARRARGVRDVAPGYCTVGVHFDPLQTDLAALEHAIQVECSAVERSEEHTSELQSPCNLVCRLLLEKKKTRRAYV